MTKKAASGKAQRKWSVDKVAGIGRKLGIYDLVEFTPKI
jgi:hypothetical protein